MPNPLKTLLLNATILMSFASFNVANAGASVVIGGVAYPSGCTETATGIHCPKGALNQHIEKSKRISPPKMPGHSSNGRVARQPVYQPPVQCERAVVRLNHKLGEARVWFRTAIYRSRVLTAQAASGVRDYITTYSMRAMSYGRSIYSNGRRGENADQLCREYVDEAFKQVAQLFTLVQAEAAAGNRDLENTGLNRRPSVYNR